MSERKFSFVPGEYYHIYNRGNSKQTIFHENHDYYRFIKLLFLSNTINQFKLFFLKNPMDDFERGEQLVQVGAYCLMPNHFHLLVTPQKEHGLSRFMQKVTTGYSMYFNNKYDRTGTLFEGKFKAEHVSDDRYLKYLFSYIHLNPVKLIQSDWKKEGIRNKEEAIKFCESYRYSSLPDYLGDKRKESAILGMKAFPEYFRSPADIRRDIFSWFSSK